MAENDSCHNVAKCQDDELCRKDSMGTIFGKRSAGLGHVLCHHCCTENVCNTAFTCTDNFKAPTLSCMYCSGIDMIDKCNTTITCTNDEVCFLQKYRTPMNQVKFDLGCKRSTAKECVDTLFCNHGVCKCDRIDYWTGRNCSTRKNIHSSCIKTDECKDFLYCINRSCSCFVPSNNFWNGTICVPKKIQGQTCSSSEECIGLLYCISNDHQSVNKTICRKAPKECADISFVQNDVFTIYPKDEHPKLAFCVIEAGLKWTVIQRRVNGSVDFKRYWQEYKEGFGNIHGEFWLGNDAIHSISWNGRHKLRVDLEVISRKKYYAEYSTFRVDDEKSNYLLHVTGYSGTAEE
ncbi:Hypothetical predicted protein [Mytilus galloprovincialis]|uniref:Fibrinogen C-terminal domain-containing protein n=1 Tax=Mytilus galloprovincialis TaxID=29158 RepID=A0A8B6G0N5_MYTGA|nr:Hypothetical predicted protein [Mytilus galloprovincialis]